MQKNSVADNLARNLKRRTRQNKMQMRLRDVRNAECARFLIFSAKNCRNFDAENFKNRCCKRGNSVSKTCLCISKTAHAEMKTRAVSKCDVFECARPNARDRRILREKLQRFRRRKFENSTRQMQKIACRQSCTQFETQDTAKENADAIA